MPRLNPLKKWRSVSQVAKECGVTPQAIRNAIKVNKIEAYPVGEYILIHRDQIPVFNKTRRRRFEELSKGRYKITLVPDSGRKKLTS